ncbi:MAG: thymidine phosphorylase [Clostridia bacterium]|nr:thymidine phosphorylase [Clostridia bacterium]
MNILEIIEKKRDKKELNRKEIEFFINGYTKGEITDYQAAALIMAIYINGMTAEETTNLTIAMSESGDVLDLSKFGKNVVDKHSTGGVGDKVSIVLLPIIASLGIPVAKMSGRGLGHTGGTADKLESIPGYKTDIDMDNFIKNVENIGISMITQTMNLAPADKKIYALRDTISCVGSIPLIASSIMSKKIASGANKLVLDVTVGNGAFMKNKEQANQLSREMIEIGKLAGIETVCVLTNMNEPLGYAVGNTLEVKEAINALKGDMPEDLKEVVLECGSYMIKLAGLGNNIEENKNKMLENIKNGKAYKKFLEMVQNQGGEISYIEDTETLEKAKIIEPVYAEKDGIIEDINAEDVGKLACKMGAGRIKKGDIIDKAVGIVLNKKVEDVVKKGDILGYIHINKEEMLKEAREKLLDIIKISEKKLPTGKKCNIIAIHY